jgi:hypothetical protein
LGTIQPKKRNGSFDQDCQIALDTRNEARKRIWKNLALENVTKRDKS